MDQPNGYMLGTCAVPNVCVWIDNMVLSRLKDIIEEPAAEPAHADVDTDG
jgi:hypothetical protein